MKIKTTVLSLFFLLVTSLMAGCNNQQATMSRDAFKQATFGKSQEQVLAAVGRPYNTQDDGDRQRWYYDGLIDPVTGQVGSAQVVFHQGIVESVNF